MSPRPLAPPASSVAAVSTRGRSSAYPARSTGTCSAARWPSSSGSRSAATLAALAASYLEPWSGGVSLAAVDDAHLHWADYRDPQWGGYVPLGTSHNRLLRINVLRGRLYYVNCAGAKSTRRKKSSSRMDWMIRAWVSRISPVLRPPMRLRT